MRELHSSEAACQCAICREGLAILNIVECSNDKELTVLKHGEHVFHDALARVQEGETRFRVVREDGEDYDLQYTDNMDLFPEQVKSVIMVMTGNNDLHPKFLTYDEDCMDLLCLEFLQQFNKAEFECLDEYTVAMAKVILNTRICPSSSRTAESTGSCLSPTALPSQTASPGITIRRLCA